MKKILYIIPRFSTGGAERLVLSYARALPKHGFQVAVASTRGAPMSDRGVPTERRDGELLKQFENCGARVMVARKNYWQTLKALRALVKRWQPDIIHTHLFSADLSGYLLTRVLPLLGGGMEGVKWITTQHNQQAEAGVFRRLVWQKILRPADAVIAVSESVAKFCRGFLLPERVMVIQNGIDLAPWLAVLNADLLAEPALRLGIIGRLERAKGHEVLLQALSKLSDTALVLHVIGDGRLQAMLKRTARQLGIAARVQWHGTVADVPTLLGAVDVVVQPSAWEGNSLAVMEAMAAGRVVIASPAAGDGLIEHGETGFIAPAEPRALADAIRQVSQHRDEARAMGQEARAYAEAHFSVQDHLKRLLQLYEAGRKH